MKIKNQALALSLFLGVFSIQQLSAQKFMLCGAEENLVCTPDGKIFPAYESASRNYSNSSTAFVSKEGLFGIVDLEKGKEILPCKYNKIYRSDGHETIVLLEQGKQQFFYDFKSKKQISPAFESLVAFIDGEAVYLRDDEPFAARVNGKCGSMTLHGKTCISFEYDNLISQYAGYNPVNIAQKGKDCFLVDSVGNRLNNENYTDIPGYWDQTYFIAYKANAVVFLDKTGKEFNQPEGTETQFQKFQKDGNLVLLNVKGEKINKENYDFWNLREWKGFFIVTKNGKQGVIDQTGKEVITLKYDYIDYEIFSEEIKFSFKRGEESGFLNTTGEESY